MEDKQKQEQLINTARQNEQVLRQRELSDIRLVLSNPEGKRVFWRFLETAGIFKQSFAPNSKDVALSSAFNEGVRSMGLRWLMELNEADPQAMPKIQQEAELERAKRIKPKGEIQNED